MKKEIIIIVTLFLFCGVNLFLNLRPDEKQIPDPNIELFKYKFETIQNRIDSLRVQVISFESKTDTIKLQILRDETTIKNLDNNGIDSAFAVLLQSTR